MDGVQDEQRVAQRAGHHQPAELMTLSSQQQGGGVQLELLTGPLTGIYDPHGMGSMLFAVLAVAAQLDRDYIGEKTLEGQQAAARGNHDGRLKVIDEDDVLFARALREKGTPMLSSSGSIPPMSERPTSAPPRRPPGTDG
nr:recombinase family protein [Streptosporangium roseum]